MHKRAFMDDNEDEQYQKKLRRRVAEAVREAQIEEQKKGIARQFLDSNAYERLMNIRSSNKELYNQVLSMIVSIIQNNYRGNMALGKITDAQLKDILNKITYRKEPKIEFRHK